MGRNLKVWFTFLLYVNCCSCNPFDFGECDGDGPSKGNRVVYRNNSLIASETLVDSCVGNGRRIEYYPSGKVKNFGIMVGGLNSGDWIHYDSTGKATCVKNWNNGVLNSIKLISINMSAGYDALKDSLTINKHRFKVGLAQYKYNPHLLYVLATDSNVQVVSNGKIIFTILNGSVSEW